MFNYSHSTLQHTFNCISQDQKVTYHIVNHCVMSHLLIVLTAVKSSHLSKQALRDYHCPWVVLLCCCYTQNIMGCIVKLCNFELVQPWWKHMLRLFIMCTQHRFVYCNMRIKLNIIVNFVLVLYSVYRKILSFVTTTPTPKKELCIVVLFRKPNI